MAPSGSKSSKQSAWERLQQRFSRDRSDDTFDDDQPRHRGLVITICLLISAVLWFIFTMQETYSVTMELPTQVVNLPEDQALAELPPSQVQAQVRGKGFSLLNLTYNPPIIPLNASAQQVNLMEAAPELPKNMQLESVNPAQVALRKDEKVTRRIPIRLRADIETPATHDLLEEPTLEPDSIQVTGARSIVNKLHYWPTVSYEVDGLKDSLSVHVPLADTLSSLVDRSVDSARLQAVARQFTEGERKVDVLVTGTPTTETQVTLDPSSVRVRYRVLFDQYEQAEQADDFFATVSYETIRADTTGRVQPRLHTPSDLTLRDVEMIPSSIRYYNVLN